MKTDNKKIKDLIERYLEGRTTLEEESYLAEYFNNEEVPEELVSFKSEFEHYDLFRNHESRVVDDTVTGPSRSLSLPKSWLRIAATVSLMAVSFYLGTRVSYEDTMSQEMTTLKDEVNQMKELTIKTLLEVESSHKKIEAIVLASQLSETSPELIHQVVSAFQTANNSIVKSVALEFLIDYSSEDYVRQALIESILMESPEVQWEILSAIYLSKDTLAIERIESIMNSDSANTTSKDVYDEFIKSQKGTEI